MVPDSLLSFNESLPSASLSNRSIQMDSSRNDDLRIVTSCLLILTAIAVGASLYWLRPIIVPFVWAVFAAMALEPVIGVLMKYARFPSWLALLVTLLLVFAAAILVGGLIAASIKNFAADASQYEATVQKLLDRAVSTGILEKLGLSSQKELDISSLAPAGTMKRLLLGTTNAMMNLLSRGTLIMLFTVFLMIGGAESEAPQGGVLRDISSGVRQYISTKVFVSAMTGSLVALCFWLLGVPYSITFGAFAFILNFIPSVGSIISTILPAPVLLLLPGITPTLFILALGIPGMIQVVLGNVVEPKLMGRSLDLHPITVLLALMFWATIWGFEGAILAVPITVVVKIALEQMKATASVADLMAGRLGRLSG